MSSESLFVSDFCHSSDVEITEEGVECAAGTALMVCLGSSMTEYEFRADRPFLFIIYNTELDIPVFINAIYNPSAE